MKNVYESCEFLNDSWNCEGPIGRIHRVDDAGQPTQRRTVFSTANRTELSATLGFTGHRTSQETFYQWSGDATDPNNEPVAVTYDTTSYEVDRYRFVPHTSNGDLKTKKVTIIGLPFANDFAP